MDYLVLGAITFSLGTIFGVRLAYWMIFWQEP